MAQQHWRVAAAVLEHQHLSAVLQSAGNGGHGVRRKTGGHRSLAYIGHAHRGWFCITGTLAQAQVRVTTGVGVVQRFQRGRGASQQHRYIQRLAAHQGEITRVVAHAVLLLVTAVVFFIDDDQSGIRHWSKNGRTRAHCHACFATDEGSPASRTLGVVQTRMQCVYGYSQALAETRQRLWRQADFRHQHQGLLATRQAVGNRMQVNLGLAAAGHAIQQYGGEAVCGLQGIHRSLLFRIQAGSGFWQRCMHRGRHGHTLHQAALGQ